MPFEIADVRVVVRREKAQCIIDLCACVDDALRMVGESCQVYTVFLRLEFLCVLALFAIVYLEGIVIASYNGKLARVIEVE